MNSIRGLLDTLRSLVKAPSQESDGVLLDAFVRGQDEQAFSEVVRRHASMVLAVGRRMLHDEHAAEDVAQAAFLVLARKSASVRNQESVGGWLYRVTYHLALLARKRAQRRTDREREAENMRPTTATGQQEELRRILDEEIQHLPRKYQEPIILCYLEGRTHEEAADLLQWPEGTVKGRLSRGRDMLRNRLVRRGMSFASAGFAALLTDTASRASVSSEFVAATLQTVMGRTAAGTLPSVALTLADDLIRVWTIRRFAWAAAVILAFLGIGGTGVGYWWREAATTTEKTFALTAEALADIKPTRLPCDDDIDQVAFSRDGKSVVAVTSARELATWEVQTGQKRRGIPLRGKGQLAAIAGDMVCHAGDDNKVEVMDIHGKYAEPIACAAKPTALAMAPNKPWLAIALTDRSIEIWNLDNHKKESAYRLPVLTLTMRFARDGSLLAVGDHQGNVNVLEIGKAEPRHAWKAGTSRVCDLDFSQDKGQLAVACGSDIQVVDLASQKARALIGHDAVVTQVRFARNGTQLYSCGEDQTLRVWSVAKGKLVGSRTDPEEGAVRLLAEAPDGLALVTASDLLFGATLNLWVLGR